MPATARNLPRSATPAPGTRLEAHYGAIGIAAVAAAARYHPVTDPGASTVPAARAGQKRQEGSRPQAEQRNRPGNPSPAAR